MKNSQKGFANIALIIVIIAIIAVGGYFVFVKKLEPVTQQIPPTPTQTSSNQLTPTPSSETADWKTYRNTKYSYEIQYSKDWTPEFDFAFSPKAKIIEHATVVNFFGKNMMISFSRKANDERLPPKEWMKKYNIPTDFPPPDFDPLAGFSEATFKGLPALRYGNDLLPGWFVFRGTDVFAVAAFGPNEPSRPFDKDILIRTYQTMLASFDLSPKPVDSLGGYIIEEWTAYSNSQFGFEIDHPAQWAVRINAGYPTTFVDLTTNEYGGKGLSIGTENTSFQSPEEWLRWYFLVYSTRSSVPEFSRLTVGGEAAIRFIDPTEMGGLGETIAVIKSGRLYRIFPIFPVQEVVDAVISTFKFIR